MQRLSAGSETDPAGDPGHDLTWQSLRRQFELPDAPIQMALMLVAPHPACVRRAIDDYRSRLDRQPVEFVKAHRENLDRQVAQSAAQYLAADSEEIALTTSTTEGLALIYSGLKIEPGDDLLTCTHGHYSSDVALQMAAQRFRFDLRRVPLYDTPAMATVDDMLQRLRSAIRPSTRVVAVPYVDSGTGVKMPISAMAELIQELNGLRPAAERIYLIVDAVHAFGVEDFTVQDLGCDFLIAGTHKWLFGPRGTGVIWARRNAWDMVDPIVPQFNAAFDMWMGIRPCRALSFFEKLTAGGFQAFEHRWALEEAFKLHLRIGKDKIQARTHQLATLLKQGLEAMPNVTLHTPMCSSLSSGIVCFEVAEIGARDVVKGLRERGIVASIAPYKTIYPRLAPCVLNSEAEARRTLEAVASLRP